MQGSSATPLLATYQALSQMGQVTDDLERAMREFRFEDVSKLSQRHTELRKQLNEAKHGLSSYRPSTADELELIKQLRPLTERVAEGDRLIAMWQTDLATRHALGALTVTNALKNLPILRSTPRVGVLKGAFEGRPAIIAAAGPSRDKQFPLIKAYQDRAVVITINRCVDAFIDQGIVPDLVMATDPQDALRLHVENVTPENTPNVALRMSVNPQVMETDVERRFFFTDGSEHELGLTRLLGFKGGDVLAGASVANTAALLAMHMGCNPVIMVGQDLAYTDNRAYPESDKDNITIEILEDEEIAQIQGSRRGIGSTTAAISTVRVPGYYGDTVITDHPMASMIRFYEQMLTEYKGDTVFYNATEGGAHIPGMVHQAFSEVLETHCVDRFDAKPVIAQAHESAGINKDKDETQDILHTIKQEVERVQHFAGLCIRTLKKARTSKKAMARVKSLYAQLNQHYALIAPLLHNAYIMDEQRAFEQKRAEQDPYDEISNDFQDMQRGASWLKDAVEAALVYGRHTLDDDTLELDPVA